MHVLIGAQYAPDETFGYLMKRPTVRRFERKG